MALLLERCSFSPSASAATVGGAGGWYSPAARAYATAASTAVPMEPRETFLPFTLSCASKGWRTPSASSATSASAAWLAAGGGAAARHCSREP